jgi:hypothetical protein
MNTGRVTPVSTRRIRAPQEGSRLHIAGNTGAVSHLWKTVSAQNRVQRQNSLAITKMAQDIAALRLFKPVSAPPATLYPFMVYRSPSNPAWRGNDFSDKGWRTFRVRAGRVGLWNVKNTDGGTDPLAPPDPDNPFASPNYDPDRAARPGWLGPPMDFEVPDGKIWKVWIDCRKLHTPDPGHDPEAVIGYGEDGPPGEDPDAEDLWWRGDYILVAEIDCQTYAEKKVAVIRQLRRADVVLVPMCVNNTVKLMPV